MLRGSAVERSRTLTLILYPLPQYVFTAWLPL